MRFGLNRIIKQNNRTDYPHTIGSDVFWSYLDLGIIRFHHHQNDSQFLSNCVENCVDTMIRIYGYPGDVDKFGDPYEHSGPIKKVYKVAGSNRSVLRCTVQTTEGQSGSPFFSEKENSSGIKKWALVGIHVGVVQNGPNKSFNVGTAITLDVND
jgi:V8-like Glu-specific endopeptidase